MMLLAIVLFAAGGPKRITAGYNIAPGGNSSGWWKLLLRKDDLDDPMSVRTSRNYRALTLGLSTYEDKYYTTQTDRNTVKHFIKWHPALVHAWMRAFAAALGLNFISFSTAESKAAAMAMRKKLDGILFVWDMFSELRSPPCSRSDTLTSTS